MPSVHLPQGRIDYLDQGEGRPVVFVHGYLMGGELWQDLADELVPRGFRCLMPTWPLGAHRSALRPGADRSFKGQATTIAQFLEALDLEDVLLVGNDSGGALCQVVATEHPERLGALVLTNCDAFDDLPPSFFKLLVPLARRFPQVAGALVQPFRLGAVRRSPVGFGLLTDRGVDHLAAQWVKPALSDKGVQADLAHITATLDNEVTREAARRLPAFDRPTLVAWAIDDRLFPLENGARLAQLIPGARLETLPGKCFSMVDRPAQLAALIAGFGTSSAPAGIEPLVGNRAAR